MKPPKYPMPPKKQSATLPQLKGLVTEQDALRFADLLVEAAEQMRLYAPHLSTEAGAEESQRFFARSALALQCRTLTEEVAEFSRRL